MDEYVLRVNVRLQGRIPVGFVTVPNDAEIMTKIMLMSGRPGFRRYYFNDKKMGFENTDRLVIIGIILMTKDTFNRFMRTKWCKKYAFIKCDVDIDDYVMDVEFYFTDSTAYVYSRVPILRDLDVLKSLSEKFVCETDPDDTESSAIYTYKNRSAKDIFTYIA